MNIHRLIEVGFLSPTDHRGARVVIKDMYFQEKAVLAYDYQIGHILHQAIAYLKSLGMNVVSCSETKDKYYLAVDDFDCRIAAKRGDKEFVVTTKGTFEIPNETK